MVYSKYFESDNKFSLVINKLRDIFSLKNVVFIILSFIFSTQIFHSDYSQLSVVMLGLASVFNVPLLLVAVFSGIGMIFSTVTTSGIIKLVFMFVLFTIITSLINIEGISKKYSTLLKLIISILIVEVISSIISSSLLLNLFDILKSISIIAIFYMVFVPGIYVLSYMKKGYVYSKEETIAMAVLLGVASIVFKDLTIYNVSVMNILLFLIVLLYSWKNGAILGIVSGFGVGMLLTLICDINIVTVVMLAFSGLVAGILRRFGKLGVVIGFLIGNIYIIFYASGMSDITLRISELLIASTALLIIPKKVEDKILNVFDLNLSLPKPYENMLDSASITREKINTVSNIFEELSNVSVLDTTEEKVEFKKIIKRYILDYIECSCMRCELKKECRKNDRIDLIVENITLKLENNEKIEVNIFSDLECNKKDELISSIEEVYSNIRVMKLLKQKEIESSRKVSNQYKEVASILRNVSKNIKASIIVKDELQSKLRSELKLNGYMVYEDEYYNKDSNFEYTFVTNILTNIDKQKKHIISIVEQITTQKVAIKLILNSSKTEKSRIKVISVPKYDVKTSIVSHIKEYNDISGDSYLIYELNDKKQALILSDGAASGKEASNISTMVVNTLEKLFKGGFDTQKSIEILNSVIKLKQEDGQFATVDICIIDLNTAELNLIKIGAAPTYIVDSLNKVTTITSLNLPIGLNFDVDTLNIVHKLNTDGIIVQLTDGALDDELNVNNNFITDYLKSVDIKKSTKIISDEISKLILKNKNNVVDDDITVLVSKVIKNK